MNTLPTKIPSAYQWLANIEGLPNTIKEALALFGVQEISGSKHSATIMSWRDELNLAGVKVVGYATDEIPWCGLFTAIVTYRRMDNPRDVVTDPLWARNWAKYGVKADVAELGDILVFERAGGGGHVGFYVAEDNACYHVLGGNQSDKVCITRIDKIRCIAKRRPAYNIQPAGVKPYRVTGTGAISKNEA